MTTISVPIDKNMEAQLDTLVQQEVGSSRADVMRRGLKLLSEEEAVRTVLRAMAEPSLRGDLQKLAKKIR
jgi:Arc/MetJ-type ribon-helix-helix transcriptional regulator